MTLSSTYKDQLKSMVESHYSTSPLSFVEEWSTPTAQEGPQGFSKLTVTFSLPTGIHLIWSSAVPDQTQGSVDKAYQTFLRSMTGMLPRNPFNV